ncbi:MAG: hypothetical protein RSB71_03325 [Bacilli bacterium]
MNDFVRDLENKIILYKMDDNYLLSQPSGSKVIFKKEGLEDDKLLLSYNIESSCLYQEFILCLEFLNKHLFETTTLESIIIPKAKNPFINSALLKQGYVISDGFIIKNRPLVKKRR